MNHDGCSDKCGGCWYCTLSICKVCGLYEGALTTDCPGHDVDYDVSQAIYAGVVDFLDGAWVGQCSAHSPAAYDESTAVPVTPPRRTARTAEEVGRAQV